MRYSLGGQALRNDFYIKGGKDLFNFEYTTRQAAWDTLINLRTLDWTSTSAQVGGFGSATAINNRNGTVTFTIQNAAGWNSFSYHAFNDRIGTTGRLRTINQTFRWTEENYHNRNK